MLGDLKSLSGGWGANEPGVHIFFDFVVVVDIGFGVVCSCFFFFFFLRLLKSSKEYNKNK